jgi:hypothetical protein
MCHGLPSKAAVTLAAATARITMPFHANRVSEQENSKTVKEDQEWVSRRACMFIDR